MRAGIVVPAHNEERYLGACLRSAELTGARIIVVADACSDGTLAVARAFGATVIETDARNVGVARDLGVTALIRQGADWIATTDADTLVPPCWLLSQLRYAEEGWHAVAGSVTITDWTEHPTWRARLWAGRYPEPGLHGANLGFTAAAYQAAGGFPPLRTGEDRAFVHALEAAGGRVLRTSSVNVVTSARRHYRAPRGFGHLLASLTPSTPPTTVHE
ncbi:glycosyltransferase [Spirillospora sp. NPDC047279]|uniref:glycosyltransferase n=1 Tax=Spirillospora sp. NPDC047279 TaxID=3155478 RepID=UPI0033F5E317